MPLAFGRLTVISKFIALLVFASASILPMWAQSSTRLDWQSQESLDILQHAYERAFRVQSNMDRYAVVREYGVIPGLISKDLPQFRPQLTEEQFLLFRNSAWRFDRVDQASKSRIRALAKADRAGHPNTRVLSEDARMKIDALVSERLKEVSSEVRVLHFTFGEAIARQLDENVVQFYAESSSRAFRNVQRWMGLQDNAPGFGHDLKALGVASPKSTLPGGPNCQLVPPDEQQQDDEECYDEGGTYNYENCECEGGGDGGGGGSSVPVHDVTPEIGSVAPNTWNAGTTTAVTITGIGFGTNEPTLSFSDPTIGYSLSSYNSGQIMAEVTVPPTHLMKTSR